MDKIQKQKIELLNRFNKVNIQCEKDLNEQELVIQDIEGTF